MEGSERPVRHYLRSAADRVGNSSEVNHSALLWIVTTTLLFRLRHVQMNRKNKDALHYLRLSIALSRSNVDLGTWFCTYSTKPSVT